MAEVVEPHRDVASGDFQKLNLQPTYQMYMKELPPQNMAMQKNFSHELS